jgi:hypothetical protein
MITADTAYLLGTDPPAGTTIEQDVAGLLEQWVQQPVGLRPRDP